MGQITMIIHPGSFQIMDLMLSETLSSSSAIRLADGRELVDGTTEDLLTDEDLVAPDKDKTEL